MRVCEADIQVVIAIIANEIHPLAQDRPDLVLRIKVQAVDCITVAPWGLGVRLRRRSDQLVGRFATFPLGKRTRMRVLSWSWRCWKAAIGRCAPTRPAYLRS